LPRRPRSPGSASSEPPDAYTAALVLLSQRELSEAQVRTRLARRGCPAEAIDAALTRLTADGTLDDRRVARAAARSEAAIHGRGPARVRRRLLALGLDADVVQEAVAATFEDVDEEALLDAALARRLRGHDLAALDDRARARLIRGLIGQGFAVGAVLKRIRGSGF
jgi:regulatory protein